MISAGDFRNGMTFDDEGQVFQIIEFQHVKPGKGAAFVRTKIRNVITGSVVERTFNPTDKFPEAYIERKEMSYSYADGELCYFMDVETYDLMPLNRDTLGNGFRFIKEEQVVKILSYKGNVFGVDLPKSVELTITDTEPGFKGDTATNVTKPATVETGAEVRVPLFIDIGDVIRVDTESGDYLERMNKK
ncbi:MAG: elongation factor P [Clostridia bacterium]|nr:elongation factor P [Clostridia bacterium]